MGRLTKAWAIDKPLSRKQRKAERVRKKELAHLIKTQASEMKNENLSRICGD